ncbi:MAG TPA: GntR family transcriptional regulator [Hyphomicrobiaceae bacterium]|nr:GntR family transcriptional regulator [Hyphomicrobiaceae bacterium]
MNSADEEEESRPLYARVREQLIERIRSGAWKPGQLIPNEFEIAREFGVSQGTARKAISALAAEQLVHRRQGRGTFVVQHTPAHVLFRFFQLFEDAGAQIIPDSRRAVPVRAPANAAERAALGLDEGEQVIRIARTRLRHAKPFIVETIALPDALFPGLADLPELPNTLYDHFQKTYGVLVVRADERITAVAADKQAAAALELAEGTPLLRIDRTAYGLVDQPVEWRVSQCHLQNAYYLARLR